MRLRDERLVEIVPQLGTFVTRISERRRSPTRSSSARRSSARRSAAPPSCAHARTTSPRWRTTCARQERAREATTSTRFYVLDDAFHHALCDLRGHAIVVAASASARKGHLEPHPAAEHARARLPGGDDRASTARVVAAVADHDPDGAEALLRDHLRIVLQEPARASARSTPTTSRRTPDDHGRIAPGRTDRAARAVRADGADPRLRDRGRAPVQGRPIGGYCHLSSGQEATTVGVVARACSDGRPARHRLPLPRLRARARASPRRR